MSILNIENLSFSFGDKTIFKNMSLRLLKGEHAGLVGVNGAGKTTLFNILTEKLICDEGNFTKASSCKIGYVKQNSDINENLTIKEVLREAYRNLYELEEKVLFISNKLATGDVDDYDKLINKLGHLQDRLDSSEFYNIEKHIETMCKGLGITALGMDTPFKNLSGGQKTKVMLAKLLLEAPDILLLDEPTNYLDKEHIEWLSKYLHDYENAFVVISHDTSFLNKITNVIFNLEFSSIKRYMGNYDNFLKLQDEERKRYIAEYTAQQKEIQKLQNFIDKNKVRASTAKMAKGRQKALDKIEKLEKPKIISPKPSFSFNFKRTSASLVMKSSSLTIGYSYPLIKNLDLTLKRGEKIAITGCNGIGKSTFLKTIMGVIPPIDGDIKLGDYLYPAYFEQQVHGSDHTPLEEVWDSFPKKSQSEIRAALGRCGIKNEHMNQKLKTLSGGEQSKVRLCKLTLTPTNWLLLDEPTNHLDAISKAELKKALIDFKGTLLLVCHEVDFYKDLATQVWNMEELLV